MLKMLNTLYYHLCETCVETLTVREEKLDAEVHSQWGCDVTGADRDPLVRTSWGLDESRPQTHSSQS